MNESNNVDGEDLGKNEKNKLLEEVNKISKEIDSTCLQVTSFTDVSCKTTAQKKRLLLERKESLLRKNCSLESNIENMRSSEIGISLKEIKMDHSELRQDLLWNHIEEHENENTLTELGKEIGMSISWMEILKYMLERYILYSPTISSYKKLQQVLFASIHLQDLFTITDDVGNGFTYSLTTPRKRWMGMMRHIRILVSILECTQPVIWELGYNRFVYLCELVKVFIKLILLRQNITTEYPFIPIFEQGGIIIPPKSIDNYNTLHSQLHNNIRILQRWSYVGRRTGKTLAPCNIKRNFSCSLLSELLYTVRPLFYLSLGKNKEILVSFYSFFVYGIDIHPALSNI